MSPEVGFALVAAAHVGFQLTVTVLVYPALVEVPAERWAEAHTRHSRRIAPIVVLLYGALVLAGGVLVARGPGAAGWVGLGGAAATIAVTAAFAAPTHGRLGDGPSAGEASLRRRLVVVDRWRCLAAVVAAAGAGLALVT